MLTEEQKKLVEDNQNLVWHIVRKRFGSRLYDEDLISAGKLGLVQAAKTFDPMRGYKFSTYAGRAIFTAICEYIVAENKVKSNEFTFRNESNVFEERLGECLEDGGMKVDLERAMATLRDEERQLVLDRVSGMPFKEIAKKYHISNERKAYWRYKTVIEKLKKSLNGYEVVDAEVTEG